MRPRPSKYSLPIVFYCFFYSPTTAALLNSSRQVLPSDFWHNMNSKKSMFIEFIRSTLTRPQVPEKKLSCTCRLAIQSAAHLLFSIVFYSPTTAALFNSSRLVLPSDFWRHIKSKKSNYIEYIRTSLTKAEVPEKFFCTHAALLFKVQTIYSFVLPFYSPRITFLLNLSCFSIYLYLIIYILINWLFYLSIYLSIDLLMYLYKFIYSFIHLFIYVFFIDYIYWYIYSFIYLFINGTKCWNNLHLTVPKLFSKLWKQKDRVK